MTNRFALIVVLVLTTACHTPSVTGPSGPPHTTPTPAPQTMTLTFRAIDTSSGALDAPVADAMVSSGGQQVGVTNGNGNVTGLVSNPSDIILQKNGFVLGREFTTGDAEGGSYSIAVFNSGIKFDEDMIANVNYDAFDKIYNPASTIWKPKGNLYINDVDPSLNAQVTAGAASETSAANKEFSITVGPVVGNGVPVKIYVDPNDNNCWSRGGVMCAYLERDGNIITAARIVVKDPKFYPTNVLSHELGHVLGLHHDRPRAWRSIMDPGANVDGWTATDIANFWYRKHRHVGESYVPGVERSPGVGTRTTSTSVKNVDAFVNSGDAPHETNSGNRTHSGMTSPRPRELDSPRRNKQN